MNNKHKFIIISPVHNEEEYLDEVIQSVVNQSVKPLKWIIVNDRSTDNSAEIIKKYQNDNSFIELVQIDNAEVTDYYARRTQVFLYAYDLIKDIDFEFLCALDADLILPEYYYKDLLSRFDNNPKLGIASGVYLDKTSDGLKPVNRSKQSTSGGLQVFRKECYEQIGGYTKLPYGGDDSLAEYTARMNGWQTRCFSQLPAQHLRPVGTRGKSSMLKVRYSQGKTDYYIGTHWLFMVAKSINRSFVEKPFLLSGLIRLIGYMSSFIRRENIFISPEIVKYVHKEQMRRLLRK